jgi:hypothetical protein
MPQHAITQHCLKIAEKWINPRRSIQIFRMFGFLTRSPLVFPDDHISLRVILFDVDGEYDVAQVSNTDWFRLHRNHRRRADRCLRTRGRRGQTAC